MNLAAYDIDLDVFRRYAGVALPRHVAYPMPTWWHELTPAEGAEMLLASRKREEHRDLSLYVHIPFCERACRYCACTRIAMEKCLPEAQDRTARYVDALATELRTLGGSFGSRQTLRQIHWGGGTPTYLDPDQFSLIHEAIRDAFTIADDAEIAIELDPRVSDMEVLTRLRDLGFNRVSMGVQDFDEQVQEHVGRVQPVSMVQEMVDNCRSLGFKSLNFDLIYGLPMQTLDSVRRTLERTIEIGPDRIAYYQYAQIPDKVAEQRGMDYTKMADSEGKLAMYLLGQEMLPAAGYVFVGLDHFAKEDEPLAVAMRNGTLQRNFQGMTTGGKLDLVGAGASAIGQLYQVGYLQNRRGVEDYVRDVNAHGSATYRGKRFTADDVIRQAVIRRIYCDAEIRPKEIEAQTGVNFAAYFQREIAALDMLAADGLLVGENDGYRVTDPLGRVLLRTIGSVFDAYLEPDAWRVGDRQYFSSNA